MKNNYKVGIYLRLSRDDKTSGESQSISNQRKLLMNYIDDHNLEFIDEYVDDGVSGTTFNRLGFNRMINDCKNKKINMIITKDTSRLGRDHIDFGYYVERFFPEHNIRYVAVNDNIDTFNDNYGNDMLVFKSAFNDMYVKDISNKLKSSLYTKKRNGEFIGAYAPYGYNKSISDKHKLVINNDEAKIVKRIFNMFINGYSINKIKDILTYEHIKTPSMSKKMNINHLNNHYGIWSSRTINDILKNEIYIGNLVQCKQKKVNYKSKKRIRNHVDNYIICQNVLEPIIDKPIFSLAQNMFKSNKYKQNNHITDKLLLRGLVYCHECRHTIGFRVQKQKLKNNDVIRIYGNCNYWTKRKSEHLCTPHSIKYSDIEESVLEELKKIMNIYLNEKIVMNIINKYHKEKNVHNIEKEVMKIDNEITKINNKIDMIYNDKLEGLISVDRYKKMYNNLKMELDSYYQLKKQYNCKLSNQDTNQLLDIIKKLLTFNCNSQLLISNLVDKIEIDKDKNMYIYYKFKLEKY
ncbi:MAG: recombinase family protein [Bacilli bacterium]|nr:recombinase family protein [Bacilli bacterium]